MAIGIDVAQIRKPGWWPALEPIEEKLRDVRPTIETARHAAADTFEKAAVHVQRHPVRAAAAGIVFGAVAGGLFGFAAGWFARRRG